LSDKVTIRIGGADIEIADKKLISDTQITANIPADSTAGIKAVQVAQQFLFDAKDSGHLGYESNVAAFVLAPQITSVTPNTLKQGDNLTVNFQPAATPKQKVTVLIGDYVILVTLPPKDSTTYPLQTILVQVPSAILPGAYKVRLRVDGADSLPKDDPSQVVQVTSGP
jgi:hypothetical protein